MISYKILHNILAENDDAEKLYLTHPNLPDYSAMEKTVIDGEAAYIISSAGTTAFPYTPSSNIKLVKSSRYRPVANHIHSWIEMGYMYSGSCEHRVHKESSLLTAGQTFILDCNTPHSLGCMGKNDILVSIIMNKSFFTDAFFNHFSEESILSRFLMNSISERTSNNNYILFHTEKNRRVFTYMHELMCEHVEPSIHSHDVINTLMSLLFLELINAYESDMAAQVLSDNQQSILPILKYIETNYMSCTLASTASFFHINPNYLTSLLKRSTGFSFKELIQKQRFRSITNLLRNTTLPIDEIAQQSGYANLTFFYKKFRAEYNCSPAEYREQHRSHIPDR